MITKQDILEEFNEEVPATRKMLERVPFDKLDFKPSPKSMPLGQMATMISLMPSWFVSVIVEPGVDTGTFKQPPKPQNVKEMLQNFDSGIKEFEKVFAAMDESSLEKDWSLKMGGKVIMEMPRRIALRQTVNHLVHHRAQLGVYLKMLGIPHPAVYGPSGDEQ
jgi:uncharacterized damage-inducible protein DinB